MTTFIRIEQTDSTKYVNLENIRYFDVAEIGKVVQVRAEVGDGSNVVVYENTINNNTQRDEALAKINAFLSNFPQNQTFIDFNAIIE